MAILSTTKDGLQANLHELENFCKTWGFNVNTQKTKVMLFRGGGKHPRVKFQNGWRHSGNLKTYCYLGITFTSNGAMKTAITDLKAKAAKAMFKLQGILQNQNINCPQLKLKLFDSLIRPILTYGCQAWGPDLCNCKNLSQINLERIDKEPRETLQRLYKYILGINKYSPNISARSELGRYPIIIFIIKQIAKFWCNIKNMPTKLSHLALQEEKSQTGMNGSWLTLVQKLMDKLNYDSFPLEKTNKLGQDIEQNLKLEYISHISQKLHDASTSDSRLNFFSHVRERDTYDMSKYLKFGLSKSVSRPIAQLRTGCHRLPVAQGRNATPPLAISDRRCALCPEKTGDEIHFLLECPVLTANERSQLLDGRTMEHTSQQEKTSTARLILSPATKEKTITTGSASVSEYLW